MSLVNVKFPMERNKNEKEKPVGFGIVVLLVSSHHDNGKTVVTMGKVVNLLQGRSRGVEASCCGVWTSVLCHGEEGERERIEVGKKGKEEGGEGLEPETFRLRNITID